MKEYRIPIKEYRQKVTCCFGCPNYRIPSDNKVKLDWCYVVGRVIERIHREDIPEWCPLPEVKEKQDEQ